MSEIETWTLGEFFSQNTAACKTTAKTGAFIVFTEVAETSFSVRQCNSFANTSTRKSSLKRAAVLVQGLRDLKVIVSEHIEMTQRFHF